MFRILVGEDNTIAQQVMEALLEDKCNKLSIAESYSQLIEFLQQDSYDLLLLDYHLDKDANVGVPEIRSLNAKIPIYILSAEPEISLRAKMKEVEVDGFLKKPIDTAELDRIIGLFHYKASTSTDVPESNVELIHLKTLLGHNPERLLKIVKIFVQEIPVDFSRMEELILQRKWPELKSLVHRVRASYGYLGFSSLHKVISDWELDIEKEQNTQRYLPILSQLRTETMELIKQFNSVFLN